MQRKAIGAMFAVVLLGALAAGQAQPALEDYLDVYIAQVKPDKRAEFDAINKKMVAANRQNKGDTWIAMETVYGPGNRVSFISTRHGYADVETSMGAFEHALEKGYGEAAAEKLMQNFNQCLERSRQEIRRRRWDPAAFAKLIAEARWLRTVTVHVKPGQAANFEALARDLKTARDRSQSPAVLVSQAVAGQDGTVFYITTVQSSMAGFDNLPTNQQLLGDEGYQKFLKTNAEAVSGTETVINRFLPELSNAPEEVAAAAPDYWRPKSTAPVTAKTTAKSPAVNAAETTKMDDKDKKH
jgi:antibiotic biosynthesis monooxygenase (ABM) superfamily enzyme